MYLLRWSLLVLLHATQLYAQDSCSNYGLQNGSACACPVGWGGSDCSSPSCGGTVFEGSRRKYETSSQGNLTAAGCGCETDWTGLGCNVCQTSNACQTAYSNSPYGSSSGSTSYTGINNTMVCSKEARVWSAGQMSCSVQNPTLAAVFPGDTKVNIMKTLNASLSPIPNITSFGDPGSAYLQLLYNGVEQFYCQATSCAQNLDGSGSSEWSCQDLRCTCISSATFCGGGSINLNSVINDLSGTSSINCNAIDNSTGTADCAFQQTTINGLFGSSGLTLNGCSFGECLRQNVIDESNGSSSSTNGNGGNGLSGGVIAGLAVVGGLVGLALFLLGLGMWQQRKARKAPFTELGGHKASIEWDRLIYSVFSTRFGRKQQDGSEKTILDNVSGRAQAGEIMAVLGPSGAGKTTFVEILAGKNKSGSLTGSVQFPSHSTSNLRIGFVPQQDVLPSMLTVYEALFFAAHLRLPETIREDDKHARVQDMLMKLGLADVRNARIGSSDGNKRGISGGEMRRVSIGLELIGCPDVLILDEPTSGLDSVSAARVAAVLHSVAHDAQNPIAVIASIHQPSSQLYQSFDSVLLLSHGRALYSGPGSFAPVQYLTAAAPDVVKPCPQGYNVADYLLEIASDPPLALFQQTQSGSTSPSNEKETKAIPTSTTSSKSRPNRQHDSNYPTTAFTQLQCLAGREWKLLRRDKTLFLTHLAVASVLGVFCGGLYYQVDLTIAGFQSRIGCLFFLGALTAFMSLSALYNIVGLRPLFVRERSNRYYRPSVWLLSRLVFDVIPLRIVPTIVVSTITYWMAGLSPDAARFFKFLLILVLYAISMALYNFLLGSLFRNGGVAILLSALGALFQMTYAGFFVNLDSIPPVLRWLQWIDPLKYCLEALAVNETSGGLMINDTLEGVPISIAARVLMGTLFGFGQGNYYRDVLVLFAYIAGFGVLVVGAVWFRVKELR